MKSLRILGFVFALNSFAATYNFKGLGGGAGGGGGLSDLSTFDTDDLVEGPTNKYYTTARFNSSFATKSTSDLPEGTNLYFTAARAKAECVSDTAYNATSWNGVVDVGPSKNAVRDQLETMLASIATNASDISTNTSAIALKAPIASPTFTGTVAGITKAMVGLGSVDDTADSAKPVSTAQQTALDLKLDASKLSNTAYDATSWNGNTDAATKDALRDKIETLGGGSAGAYNLVTSSGSLTCSHDLVDVSSSGGANVQTLPSAAACPAGKEITLQSYDTSGNTRTVQRAGSDTISSVHGLSGATSFTMNAWRAPGSQYKVKGDGVSVWHIVAMNGFHLGNNTTFRLPYTDANGFLTDSTDLKVDSSGTKIGAGNGVTPVAGFHSDTLQSATGNAFQATHGTQTGVTATDGFYGRWPTANSSNFDLVYNESGTFQIYKGNNPVFQVSSSDTTLTDPGFNKTWSVSNIGSGTNGYGNFTSEVNLGNTIAFKRTAYSSAGGSGNMGAFLAATTGASDRTFAPVTAASSAILGRFHLLQKVDATNTKAIFDPNSSELIGTETTAELGSIGDSILAIAGTANWDFGIDNRAPQVQAITANTTLAPKHREIFVECDATAAGGDVSATAYAVLGRTGWKVNLINVGTANNCIFDGNASEQIWVAGTAGNTDSVAPGATKQYYANGALWRNY